METLRRTGIICCLLPLLLACSGTGNEDMYKRLDAALADKSVYEDYFKARVSELKTVLSEQTDPDNVYNMNVRIADAYRVNSLDSALLYLRDAVQTALSVDNRAKAASAEFKIAILYVKAGYPVEANDIMNRYRGTDIPESVMLDYYNAEHTYWGETMAYTSTSESSEDKRYKRDKYREILLTMTPENTLEWYTLKREEAHSVPDWPKVREYSQKMLDACQENSREYAEAAYNYAHAFEDLAECVSEEWLVRSAIADMMCATRDYASLNELSRIVFDHGDIDRAFRYMADHCMVDALCYNGKLRPWQIQIFFPEIEKAYEDLHTRQSRYTFVLLVCISSLFLITLCLIVFLFKRQQILESMRTKLQESYMEIDSRNRELVDVNRRLVELNARIQESDKMKQLYITMFLEMISDNINTSRQYRNKVLKYIRQGKAKTLTDEIEMGLEADDDISQFYKMFDQAFLNIYPDFVQKFNSLLLDGAEIVPRAGDILTPELRIFALIKLGITESNRIASLLHYSVNTIYNYRAQTKKKAKGSKEDFEEAVRNL